MSNNQRKTVIEIVPDPYAGMHGRPILTRQEHTGSYVGRAVIELWEKPGTDDDVNQLTLSAGAVTGSNATLFARVAAALPNSRSSAAPDPLTEFQGRPTISVGGPPSIYVGRVMVELWEDPTISDAHLLTYAVDAATGDSRTLLARIAAALPIRLKKSSVFRQ